MLVHLELESGLLSVPLELDRYIRLVGLRYLRQARFGLQEISCAWCSTLIADVSLVLVWHASWYELRKVSKVRYMREERLTMQILLPFKRIFGSFVCAPE